jgi:hypothetical protein
MGKRKREGINMKNANKTKYSGVKQPEHVTADFMTECMILGSVIYRKESEYEDKHQAEFMQSINKVFDELKISDAEMKALIDILAHNKDAKKWLRDKGAIWFSTHPNACGNAVEHGVRQFVLEQRNKS